MSEGGEARNREADHPRGMVYCSQHSLQENVYYEMPSDERTGGWSCNVCGDGRSITYKLFDPSPQGEDHEAGVQAAERAVIASARTRGWRGNDLEAWSLKADARAAVAAYLSRCPFPERDQLARLVAGIQWVRGMCSDEEPYEVIDAKLAELLGLAGESSTTEE